MADAVEQQSSIAASRKHYATDVETRIGADNHSPAKTRVIPYQGNGSLSIFGKIL